MGTRGESERRVSCRQPRVTPGRNRRLDTHFAIRREERYRKRRAASGGPKTGGGSKNRRSFDPTRRPIREQSSTKTGVPRGTQRANESL